ncbi:MAG: hypothetical protein K2J18_02230 [Paramuribaculum sp.]|nr:hypothetical protein [Bacteroides sp.]MDE6825562.1 hypothetical protein [Paramuribaculum sp.]MDE7470720.1 hypothetical protein [Paramuribaculum sp.]
MTHRTHKKLRRRLLSGIALAVALFGAALTSGCESLFWGTDLGLDSTGGVNVGVNVGGPLGSGSLNLPYYGPGYIPPRPVYRPVPTIVPPPVVSRPVTTRPQNPGNWIPPQNGGITLRPAQLPGASRPPVINQGGEPGPVIPAGQLRPGGNVRQ